MHACECDNKSDGQYSCFFSADTRANETDNTITAEPLRSAVDQELIINSSGKSKAIDCCAFFFLHKKCNNTCIQ